MSRCQEFPPLGFVWNGVSGSELIELLKVRREKAESEKEEKRKAKRMQRKSSKREHEQALKNCTRIRGLELEKTEFQLKELLEKWVRPPIQIQQTEFDDLHWLFDTRPKIGTSSTTSKFSLSPMNGVRAMPYTLLY